LETWAREGPGTVLMSTGRLARGVGLYTISGLLLLLAMGMFVPELSLLFAFATFIFLAFGLSYMGGKASTQVVAPFDAGHLLRKGAEVVA
jgi:hypothetical protein